MFASALRDEGPFGKCVPSDPRDAAVWPTAGSVVNRDQFCFCVESDLPVPENVRANKAGETRLLEEVARHDTNRIIDAERRIWEADASGVLAALDAAAYNFCLAIGTGLEELAMSGIGLADQNGRCPSVDYRPNFYGFSELEA